MAFFRRAKHYYGSQGQFVKGCEWPLCDEYSYPFLRCRKHFWLKWYHKLFLFFFRGS